MPSSRRLSSLAVAATRPLWLLSRRLVIVALAAAAVPAAADKNLPLPRFVALKSDQVNLRTGPGDRYPIDWVFTRKDMPVEIVAEFEHWRRIRDFEGTEGWVHERMLAGRRTVMVRERVRVLYGKPDPTSDIVARAEPGVIARLEECRDSWCRITAQGVDGWLRRDEVWGVYPNEKVQ